jgi:hypothetical protein
MATFDFGGMMEEVVKDDEFPLQRAREILKNEVVAVIGYGVQGPGQALNMRDNGIRVIVGQRTGGTSWQRAVDDGFVPGETLFSPEEAARRATVVQYLLSDAGQAAMWPKIKACLWRATRCISGFPSSTRTRPGSSRRPTWMSSWWRQGSGRTVRELPERQRHQQQLRRFPGLYRPRP